MRSCRKYVSRLLVLGVFSFFDSQSLRAQQVSLPLRLDVVGRGNQGIAAISIDNGPLTDVPIQDALIHLRSDTSSGCVPTYSAPCLYTVELLKLNLGPTSFQGVGIPIVEFRNSASIPLQVVPGEGGPVAILPSSLEVQSTGISEMGAVTGVVAVQTDLIMVVDLPNNNLRVSGTIDGTIAGRTFHAVVDAGADGLLLNRPPVARAQSTVVVQPTTCTTTVHLDGSASTDPNNDIVSWMWTEGRYTIGSGQVIDVPKVAKGTHTFTLVVSDSYGGQGRNDVTATVNPKVKPVFSAVPTVTANTCTNVILVPPTVTHPCGLTTTLTNNAPSQFRAGRTIVRWTATDQLGNTVSVDQDVIVYLGDEAACCPVGSHVIRGTSNNDQLIGTSGADCILGFGGQDTINGNGGKDVISGGDGDDTIFGGDGDDVIACGAGQDTAHGDNGNDFVAGNDGDDSLFGDAGTNRLEGGLGQDTLTGGSGRDTILGGDGTDTISGGSGDDVIDAGPGNDLSVQGGAGNDVILGGDGDDTLSGGDGNDSINGGNGRDTCSGGIGSDNLLSCEVVQ